MDRTRLRISQAVRGVRPDKTRRARGVGSHEEESSEGICRSVGLRKTPGVRHLQGRPQGPAAPRVHRARYVHMHPLASSTAVEETYVRTALPCSCAYTRLLVVSRCIDLLERCSEEEEEEEAGACNDGKPAGSL